MTEEEKNNTQRIYVASDDEGAVVMCFDSELECIEFCQSKNLGWTYELLKKKNGNDYQQGLKHGYQSGKSEGRKEREKEIIEEFKKVKGATNGYNWEAWIKVKKFLTEIENLSK